MEFIAFQYPCIRSGIKNDYFFIWLADFYLFAFHITEGKMPNNKWHCVRIIYLQYDLLRNLKEHSIQFRLIFNFAWNNRHCQTMDGIMPLMQGFGRNKPVRVGGTGRAERKRE